MDKRFSSVIKNSNNNRYSANRNRLNISGQSIVLGENFNILKYLDQIEKKKTEKEILQRPNRRILPTLNLQTPNKKRSKYFSLDSNNISTLINENSNSIKKSLNNDSDCFLTSLDNDENKLSEKIALKYSHSNKNKKLYDYNRLISSDIHLSSVIQEIRNKNKNNLYKICKTENNKKSRSKYFNVDLAYDNKNMEPIIRINNILNDYKDRKEWDLKMRENNYNDFINNNKELKINNVLKIIMNKEKEKIDVNIKNYEKSLENKKNIIEEDEKNFNQIIKEQKYYNRKIEDNLDNLKDHKKILLYIRESIKQYMNKVEYEIMKKLYEIDELRIYAKFVNYIYGYDTTNYEKNIIEKDAKKQEDIEVLINKVLVNYKEYLSNEKNEKISNIDPDIIYNEIKLIEDRILLALKMKDKEFEDLKNFIDKNESVLEGIRDKEQQLEKEYNFLKDECNFIINFNSNQNNDKDLFLIAQDLFNYVIQNFSSEKDKFNYNYYYQDNNNTNFNPFEIGGLAEKGYKLTVEKELLVNNYIQTIQKYEDEDQKVFSEIINTRKNQLILEKLKAGKERVQKKAELERMNIEKKSQKVYFIQRKMHQSIPKKKKLKIKIDPKVIKMQEDIEIMTYQ